LGSRPLDLSSVNPQARLEAAMNAARQGDYEGALREHLWFHEHALEHDPAYYGVRLSFALGAWARLAKAHPPARDALIQVRDATARRLLRGEGGLRAFDEVEAINSELGDRRATYELFRQLREMQPGVADACADLAWETAADFDDFVLARACVGDPSERLRAWADELNEDISLIRAELPGSRAELEDEFITTFAERVALLLRVLAGIGEAAGAPVLRAKVLDAVEDPAVRDLVQNHLESAG
jgi:hypothetical protein